MNRAWIRIGNGLAAMAAAALVSLGLLPAIAQAADDWVLDKSYGDGGVAKSESLGYGNRLATDGRGGVVVTETVTDAFGKYSSFGAARLDPEGVLDIGFGNRGHVFFGPSNYNAQEEAVSVDRKGRILIAGSGTGHLVGLKTGPELVRVDADGTRDKTFRRQSAFGYPGFGYTDVATLGSGKILVVGGSETLRSDERLEIQIRRFRENGKPDRSFGRRGLVRIKGPENGNTGATDLHLLRGGKFLVSGIYGNRPWVGRFRASGRFDRTFGKNGSATADLRQASGCGVLYSCAASGLQVTPAGDIRVLANDVGRRRETPYVVGFTKNGRPDRRYGDGGMVRVRPNDFRMGAMHLIGLPDGSALVTYSSISKGALARVSVDGDEVTGFPPLERNLDWVIDGEYADGALYLSGGKGEEAVFWKLRRRG